MLDTATSTPSTVPDSSMPSSVPSTIQQQRPKKQRSVGVKLSHRRRRYIILTVVLVTVSGLGWLLLHEFVRVEGKYGPQHHPLEAWLLRLHGLTAMLFTMLFGLLWGTHIQMGRKMQKQRYSGYSMIVICGVLFGTGYLLYYMTGENYRNLVATIHWMVGLGLASVFLAHIVAVKKKV